MGKKIGFLMAAVHQGSSKDMWKALNVDSEKHPDDSLFVFPGGRLEFPIAGEYLRNEIYSLANKENLDGAICWSSTLTGKVGVGSAEKFVRRIKDSGLPIANVGLTFEGIPSVNYDAYSGIYTAVAHLVKDHRIRRIAFIRGPEAHPSSEERYKAYFECLKNHGITVDERLVSTPRPWNDGELAIKEIVEERGLVPGVDFQAVVGASDLLLFWAVKYLENKGIPIPTRVKTIGFNDSEENAMNAVETSTVRLPIKEMVLSSYSLICNMIDSPESATANMMMPTDFVIRRSCGCSDSFGGIEKARLVITDWASFRKWITSSTESQKSADALYEIMREIYLLDWRKDHDESEIMNSLFEKYYQSGGQTKLLFESMHWAEHILGCNPITGYDKDYLHYLSTHHVNRQYALKSFEKRAVSSVLDKFQVDLLASSSIKELSEKMEEYLPQIGIEKAFVVLVKDENTSRFVAGFDGTEIFRREYEFPASHLIDSSFEDRISSGVHVVMPLTYDNTYVGYVILTGRHLDGTVLEDIGSTISSSLKGINLFSLAAEKSATAEEAEKRSSEFYARLSEGLKEPLEAIKIMADALEEIDRDELRRHVTKAGHLLELSLAERGEIELETEFLPVNIVIDELRSSFPVISQTPEKMPSVMADKTQLAEAFKILASFISESGDVPVLSASPDKAEFIFRLYGQDQKWRPATIEKDASFLFAEKIVLMHGGSFSFGLRSISITIPYPSLSGKISSTVAGHVAYIKGSEELPSDMERLGAVVLNEESILQTFVIPEDVTSIAWSAGVDRKNSSILLNLLKSHKRTRDLPFICYGIETPSISLATALEGSLPQADKATIFSFGPFPAALDKLSDFGSVVEVSSIAEAEKKEGEGALIVFYELDIDAVSRIRRSRRFSRTPILIVKDFFSMKDAELLAEVPSVLMVNTSITESEEFISRVVGIFGGSELLLPLTSALVKKSIAYLNKNASAQISRWQLAAAVNISEDYLTRIFRREIGVSPWDYLNRYRIQIACTMLTQTGASINEIASDTGFQDQAYFCRVFKKVKGFPPGHLRQRS